MSPGLGFRFNVLRAANCDESSDGSFVISGVVAAPHSCSLLDSPLEAAVDRNSEEDLCKEQMLNRTCHDRWTRLRAVICHAVVRQAWRMVVTTHDETACIVGEKGLFACD